jgi:hypothetical protein
MSGNCGGGGYDPSRSIMAGMSTAALQGYLAAAQTAYMELQLGGKVISLSYTQGDGAKSVTYLPTSPGALVMLIKQLQAQLGLICRARRPVIDMGRSPYRSRFGGGGW